MYGYLVHHPAGPVLIDTGVDAGHPVLDELYSPASIPIEPALAAHDVSVSDVIMVINTHLHFDHIGNNARFPDRPLVAQRVEHEAAGAPRYTVPDWVGFPGAGWQLLDGEAEPLPGLRLFPTSSHTAGHQSVAVTTDRGLEIVAGQALHDASELEREESAEDPDGPMSFEETARLVKGFNPELVWFSHAVRPWKPQN